MIGYEGPISKFAGSSAQAAIEAKTGLRREGRLAE
jgi:hypothetical protein